MANTGPEALNSVQIVEAFIDPLTGGPTFGDGNIVTSTVGAITPTGGAALTINPAYNVAAGGAFEPNLLVPGASSLPVGASAVIPITVTVDTTQPDFPDNTGNGFNNQATTSAVGATSNTPTNDLSDNDTTPDPDGDGNPNEVGENDPTPVTFGPDLRLFKRITAVTRNGSPLAINGIGSFNDDNDPDNNDDTLLRDSSGGTIPLGIVGTDTPLQSGDVVEYTIYFWNAGLEPVQNLELCDELQAPSILIPGSLTLATPTALVASGTTLTFNPDPLLSARAPLSALADSCISAPGTFPSGTPAGGLGVGAGGGVVVGGATSNLNVAPNEVGAFRFEIRLP